MNRSRNTQSHPTFRRGETRQGERRDSRREAPIAHSIVCLFQDGGSRVNGEASGGARSEAKQNPRTSLCMNDDGLVVSASSTKASSIGHASGRPRDCEALIARI